MKIATVSEMRAMDQQAVQEYGIPELLLMENAGLAACAVLSEHIEIRDNTFVVFCGSGNNGGDGFVVARKIHSNGGVVKVMLLGNTDNVKGISKTNLDILKSHGVEVRKAASADDARFDVAHCDAIVDAILGTGLSKDVRGHYSEIIALVNASGKPVLSLDIPSGVNGDTGQVMGCAVKADWTVTFGLPKPGNLLYPGSQLGGTLSATHISFPPAMTGSDLLKLAVNTPVALPRRKENGHKGDFGDVLFVAGAASYFGAPTFAALSFMKAGGGYARLAAPAAMVPFIACTAGEIVFSPQSQTASGSISLENEAALLALADQTDMTVIGPGLSLDAETRQLVRRLAAAIEKPLLLDGDGITAVCEDLNIVRSRNAETILTPHLGEMARLTKLTVPEIAADSIGTLQRTAADLNAFMVLKGAHSLIGLPDQRVFINTSGNCGMATAGSGDVLAGTIAAMYGLGLAVPEAVQKGVFIHGLAGDLAAAKLGQDGITAQDILVHLASAMKAEREGLTPEQKDRYRGARLV